jgi:hypothetical protein
MGIDPFRVAGVTFRPVEAFEGEAAVPLDLNLVGEEDLLPLPEPSAGVGVDIPSFVSLPV